ncbi:hypothetical protein NKR23_g11290 [Pleurostoma richardsiae]|uniref:Uncharacterized protein n=1 Tax=Pleurostoma richardsiae TaxID=41990 RepID=A0AA38R856_9PEZI|nr:hypothetical protein NKR23_g11290 [Pleurostoma richardsiae]
MNPATRGRKAALRSHAAGQVPQHVLPPDPAVAIARPLQGAIGDHELDTPRETKKQVRPPVKKMTFPGFMPAKDSGPWSREAYDLLESGRPG